MEKSIEQMLRDGVSAKELKENLEREIAAAEKRINGENVIAKTKARENVIEAMKQYALTLGIADEETIDRAKGEITKFLVDMEDSFTKLDDLFEELITGACIGRKCECGDCDKTTTAGRDDEAIARFLRGIM